MKRRVLVLPECYANKCFAEEVKEKLREAGLQLRVSHKPTYGRDRILKEAHVLARRFPQDILLLFIDYEKGPLRKYVTVNFPHLEKTVSTTSIYIGKSSRASNLVAVIFDSNIEDALGVKDEETRRILKTPNACMKLQPVLKSRPEIVEEVANKITSLINK